jgi:hypothetical protein
VFPCSQCVKVGYVDFNAIGQFQIQTNAIQSNHIFAGAVTNAKLAQLTAAGLVANSATTAIASNVANAIVLRNGLGGINVGLLTAQAGANITNGNLSVAGTAGPNQQLLWTALKSSLQAGDNNSNTGTNSIALGANNSSSAFASMALGSSVNASGAGAVAMGQNATAAAGSFVFGDGSGSGFTTAANTFVARAAGGIFLYTDATLTAGVSVASGSGAWATISDRRSKMDFLTEDPERYLRGIQSLQLTSWRYKAQAPGIRHVGPMAQDFRAVFGLGESDTTITTVDADGVSMLAIQALAKRTDDLRAAVGDMSRLRTELDSAKRHEAELTAANAALSARMTEQEKRLRDIEALLPRGNPQQTDSVTATKTIRPNE